MSNHLSETQAFNPNLAIAKDVRNVQNDVSTTPCGGHPLPWLNALCIRCGQPTFRERNIQ